MAPRRIMDKGKRPMTEVEAESPRRVTRSRGMGVHIAEPRESPRRPVIEEVHVEPEQVVREAPAVEQATTEFVAARERCHWIMT